MCCAGCEAVAQAIVNAGLVDYYRYRTQTPRSAQELVPEMLREHAIYDREALQRSFVRSEEGSVREASLILEGIVCAACVWLSERHVKDLPGVLDFRVNYSTHRAQLRWDQDRIALSEVLDAISAIGYRAHPFDPDRHEALQKKERARALRRIAVAGVGMMQIMMIAVALYAGDYNGMDAGLRDFMRAVSLLIALPVVLYSARPFFVGAWRDLRQRQLGMDVPVALAIGIAFVASAWATYRQSGEVYFDSITMFTFFLLVGRYLEMMARHKAGQAAEDLVRMLPATATRVLPQGSEVVAVSDLQPGDRVLIRPGESVPADGLVEEGESAVDESLLTGESLPLRRGEGDRLTGGTLNTQSPLIMQVDKVGTQTVLSGIIRLLERAQTEKPRLAQMADSVAAWFVGALLLVACGVYVFWFAHAPDDALWITLSVLVVTCPCALSLATPAALTAATGSLTRLGVLTTRGHALETLAKATHIIFDKTGTLTYGRLALLEIDVRGDLDSDTCLRVAAGLEQGSEHPVGQALRGAAMRAEPVSASKATTGRGIEGCWQGRLMRIGEPAYALALTCESALELAPAPGVTQVVMADQSGVLAVFSLRDRLRKEAVAAVAAIEQLGLKTLLLSGDTDAVARQIGAQAGIAQAEGGLLPADKLARLKGLQAQGAIVAMIGDGVNDAPVLAGAQVSLAMGGGSQLAQANADMVLLSQNLMHLAQSIKMARRSLRVVRQNLSWALVYNLVALPLAASGWVEPWMAAIGMSASSLIVVLNALRLRDLPARRDASESMPLSNEERV